MNPSAITSWFNVFDWSPADPRWEQRRKATWAWRKFKKARRWVRVLRFVPFVRMIAIGNSLGYGNCSPESDIDLVIVTAPRRIWTVRLLVVTLLRLFHQRPGEHTKDAICPSFFLTTEAMNLEPLQIPPRASSRAERASSERSREISSDDHSSLITHHSSLPPDPYLLFWLTQLTVLYDVGGTYEQFWQTNEAWVRRWLPDARARALHPRLCASAPPPHAPPPGGRGGNEKEFLPLFQRGSERGCGGRFADAFEVWSRRFQERRFSPEIRALANQDSRVIVNDRMLKFHTNDRRARYREQWVERLAADESSVSV